jgi:hypothetical protein
MRLAMLRSRGSDAHSRRGVRLQACALVVSLAALLCVLVVPLALATGARRAAIQSCATSGLVIWLNAEDSGAAGNFYYHLEFANQSGRTCTLAGYPGLSAVNLRGRQIGSPARREASVRPAVVTLAPEGQATALIHVIDVGALPAACDPVAAAGFRVYPPGQRASRLVPFPFRTCSSIHESAISVRSVSAR